MIGLRATALYVAKRVQTLQYLEVKPLNKFIQITELDDEPWGIAPRITYRLSPYKVKGYDPQQTSSFECSESFNLNDGTSESTVNGETISLKAGEQDWRLNISSHFLDAQRSVQDNLDNIAYFWQTEDDEL